MDIPDKVTETAGGRWALAGFLYQLLALPAIIAAAHDGSDSVDDSNLDALLEIARDADSTPEPFDSDLALLPLIPDSEHACTLVQFKYSRLPHQRPIQPSELLQILQAMISSRIRAKNSGYDEVKFGLVTNRQFSHDANLHLDAVRSGEPSPVRKGKKYEKTDKELARDETREVLKDLIITAGIQMGDWLGHLRAFAETYGATPEEIDNGAKQILADVLMSSAFGTGRRFAKPDLVKAFTGFPHAKPLTPDYVVRHSQGCVDAFTHDLGIEGTPVRREVVTEIARAAAAYNLVILVGDGGSGKSVALTQWTRDLVSREPPDSGVFTDISRARQVPVNWVARTVCRWLGNHPAPARMAEGDDLAFERILTANPAADPPFLHFAADGLDEGLSETQEGILRASLQWFWDESRVNKRRPIPDKTIVVTCRDQDDLYQQLLIGPLPAENPHAPPVIRVSDFTDGELLEAAQQCSNQVQGLIAEFVSLSPLPSSRSVDISPDSFFSWRTPFAPTTPTAPDMVESIRQPVMWRAFCTLDDSVQLALLTSSDQGSTDQLAKEFIRYFRTKVVQRKRLGLRADEIASALHTIAEHTTGKQHCRRDWITHAKDPSGISDASARTLYSEAFSGGLIVRDQADTWRWRHSIVASYLARDE